MAQTRKRVGEIHNVLKVRSLWGEGCFLEATQLVEQALAACEGRAPNQQQEGLSSVSLKR